MCTPQLDVQGKALPDVIAAALAVGCQGGCAGTATSNTWITELQLPKLLPTLDRRAIKGDPVVVELSSGEMLSFFNLSQLPGEAHTALAGRRAAVWMRSAVSGATFPAHISNMLRKVATERGFVNKFWVSEKYLPAFATKLKVGEEGIQGSTSTVAEALYNAEQTEHPERFVEENCRWKGFVKLNGNFISPAQCRMIRGHVVANNLPRDTVWSTAENLEAAGFTLAQGANPCVYSSPAGDIVAVYGASMTNDPERVECMASKMTSMRMAGRVKSSEKNERPTDAETYSGDIIA